MTRKNELCATTHDLGVKVSRVIPMGGTSVMTCLTKEDMDKWISATITASLKKQNFEVIIPPHFKAKKIAILKCLDRDTTTPSPLP